MASRFLCTTALEETWREDHPVLFLGEWCRRFARKERWSKLDAEVLPYHWDDRVKLHNDYWYLQEFHARLLPDLAGELNERHGVDRSVRYWRILIGPWLGYFVQILFDRWASIHQSVRDQDLSGTVVLVDLKDVVANDMADFVELMVGDNWNHQIYGAILQQSTNVAIRQELHQSAEIMNELAEPMPWTRRVKQTLAAQVYRLAGAFAHDRDAFFHSTDLSFRDEMRLARRLGQLPQMWRFVPAVRATLDRSARAWTVRGENRSAFEAFVRNMVSVHIPTVYIEGYKSLREQASLLPWPKQTKLIWTNNSQYLDDLFKVWSADQVERGVPLVIGQHGGHLGVGRWSFIEEHDVTISDRYLSWGWSDSQQPKVTPACQLKVSRRLGGRHSIRNRVLMVAGACPRYSYWMYSGMIARQWLDYFEDQCKFVGRLSDRLQDALTVRLYPHDYGWDQFARWHERFPRLRLNQGRCKIDDLIRECRVYISTYNATTYLQSIAMDVPTVIYWDPNLWELRDTANSYFDELRHVGIFHDEPESAAVHVGQIWDDVDSWWNSAAVREVLGRFKHQYCRAVPDIAKCVEEAIRGVANLTDAKNCQ